MNIAMRLTLDGLVRALRGKAHDLADGLERGYAAGRGRATAVKRRRHNARRDRNGDEAAHDRARR